MKFKNYLSKKTPLRIFLVITTIKLFELLLFAYFESMWFFKEWLVFFGGWILMTAIFAIHFWAYLTNKNHFFGIFSDYENGQNEISRMVWVCMMIIIFVICTQGFQPYGINIS